MRPGADNAEALAWLERALGHARDLGHKRLEDLLGKVRAEILFEMRLSTGVPPTDDGQIGGG